MTAAAVRVQQRALRKAPWLTQTFEWLIRFRWLVLVVVPIVCSLIKQADPKPTDLEIFFLDPGRRLVAHGDLNVFTPDVQIGPLTLAVIGVGSYASSAIGLVPGLGADVLMGLLAMVIAVCAVRAVTRGMEPRRVAAYELCVGAVVGSAAMPTTISYGHIEELFLPLLFVIAADHARRGNAGRAGALLAIAVSFKLWALIGVAVFVLSPRPRDWLRGTAVMVVGALIAYAPFALFGDFHTFDYHWAVRDHAPVGYVLGAGAAYGYKARVVQVVLAVAAGVAVALWQRRSDRTLWLVPATVVAVRVLIDPVVLPYYWPGMLACFIIAIALTSWPPVLRAFAIAVLLAVVLSTVWNARHGAARPIITALSLAAVATCGWASRGRPQAGARGAIASPQQEDMVEAAP